MTTVKPGGRQTSSRRRLPAPTIVTPGPRELVSINKRTQGGGRDDIIQRLQFALSPGRDGRRPCRIWLRGPGRGYSDCARRRRHLRAAAQSRAAELADESPRLQFATVLAARNDQQVECEESEARVRGCARRHLGQRVPRGHAAGRRRLHVHHRRLGRGLQDRRALGYAGPHRVEDGSRASRSRIAIAASRCGATSSSRSPASTGASSRPTRRPARSSGTRTCSIRRAWRSRRRRSRSRMRSSSAARRRQRRPLLARIARCQDRQAANGRPSRCRLRASPAARPGRTRSTPGRPAAAPSTSPAPTIPRPT